MRCVAEKARPNSERNLFYKYIAFELQEEGVARGMAEDEGCRPNALLAARFLGLSGT